MPQLSAVRGVYNLLFFLGLAPLVYFCVLYPALSKYQQNYVGLIIVQFTPS